MTENTTSESHEPTQPEQANGKERYQRIGAELRRRRESLSLEQSDVARDLHLPGMVVNDIECGQVEELSSLYRRGYIRNYARLLGLDPDRILAEAGEDLPPDLQQVMPMPRGEWRLERYLKIATYALVTVAIVPPLVYFFIAGGTRMLDRDPASRESPATAQSMDAGNARAAESRSNRSSGGEAKDSEPARHVSASALPLNPIRPVREPQAEAAEEVVTIDTELAAEEAGVTSSALALELLEDSWIEIHDAEGTRLEYDLLRSGQTRKYEGQAPFRLLVGRSSAVELQINGQPVVWEGHESGDVAEISVTAEGEVRL